MRFETGNCVVYGDEMAMKLWTPMGLGGRQESEKGVQIHSSTTRRKSKKFDSRNSRKVCRDRWSQSCGMYESLT